MPSFIYHSIFKEPDIHLVLERNSERMKGNVNKWKEHQKLIHGHYGIKSDNHVIHKSAAVFSPSF